MTIEANDKKTLLMLSGGRDSFLAACKLIAEGRQVYAVTYDNGSMSCSQNVGMLAERLIERFGEENIKYVGVQTIAQNIRPLLNKIVYEDMVDICKEYPNLVLSQVNCLACHTVMYIHAISFCKANGIDNLAEGARKQQLFFVELPEMKSRYEKLCKRHNIELIMPVYDLESDELRKMELAEWGFSPKSYEPQCWIGCPMRGELNENQRKDLEKYYDCEIEPIVDAMIEKLIEKKKIPFMGCAKAGAYV